MAKEFREHDAQFVFIYTREAHPSDRYPGHDTIEQKIEHARTMKETLGFDMEWLPQRLNDDITFVEDLFELGGSRPVEEFLAAMDNVEGPVATKPMKEWWAKKNG